jgi:uncharacterized protein YtpQ (UPF0354 family)
MSRIVQVIVAAVGLCCGCSKQTLPPSQFTKEFADALRQSSPGLKVEIIRDLELKVTSANGSDSTAFLDNAYGMYRQDPKAKSEVIGKFIAAVLETGAGVPDKVESARIIPVIKDRPWLEETRHALLSRGAQKTPEYVYENFILDLIIVYAEDSPKNIRYLTPKNLEELKIERKQLRELATENLKRLLPNIERRGTNGLYMLTAGGNYEASLLLLDSIWKDAQLDVQGDIVVAIPTRDLLLVTGSENQEGIEKVTQIVKKSFSEGFSYRLTQKLFVYRNGKFDEFRTGDTPRTR